MTASSHSSAGKDRRTTDFLQLLGKHEQGLQAFIASLVPQWADADEIVQQTRILLWQEFDRYDDTKDFGAWARTIAYYQVLTFRKQSSQRAELSDPNFLESVAQEFELSDDHLSSRYSALEICLQKLAAAHRRLLLRYYAGRETMQQVAAATGRTSDAVKHSIIRSRLAVSRCVDDSLRKDAKE
ncbi:MAG: sigma-70 family RNA polymerase sigma factor [Planctomycetia bacterium]|nr:sigma-70 family RNA polymerase sigma factor [Planctomycetia bacterium]